MISFRHVEQYNVALSKLIRTSVSDESNVTNKNKRYESNCINAKLFVKTINLSILMNF